MLYETTQRRVCRAVFLTACVLPTLTVVGWVIWRIVPSWQDRLLAKLGHQIGAHVTAEQVITPQPGKWRLVKVTLGNRETKTPLATCDWIELTVDDSQPKILGGELSIAAGRAAGAAEWLEHALTLKQPTTLEGRFKQVTAGDLVWRHPAMRLATTGKSDAPTGRRLEIVATSGDSSPRLTIERNCQLSPPSTRITLATGDQPIAWQQLRQWVADCPTLGADATFAGKITVNLSDNQSQGKLTGTLYQATLDELLGKTFGLRLAKPAIIPIEALEWQANRLTRLIASINTGPGTVDRPFLLAANQQLYCAPSEQLLAAWSESQGDEPVAFDQLTTRIQLDASGLTITGGIGAEPAPTLMLADGKPLLYQPSYQRLPANVLLYLASPEAPRALPATREAEAWARRLPASVRTRLASDSQTSN